MQNIITKFSVKFTMQIFMALVASMMLLSPAVVLAQVKSPPKTTSPATSTNEVQNTWGCEELKAQIEENGGGRAVELPEYCNEGDVYKKVVYWLYYIIGMGAVIMIIYGGYIYMTAGSNETQAKKGKNILIYTIAGIIVAIIATTIIRVIINLIVDNKII